MEYIIIFILLIFIIILNLKKQLNYISTIKLDKNCFINFNKIHLTNKNPVLIYLFENFYNSLKLFNKYNYKKYIIFNNLKISQNDKDILDWISYTGGSINMAIDSVIKMIKSKQQIPIEFINNVAKLKLHYAIFKLIKNPDDNIRKINKKYMKNKVILNLLFIDTVLKEIYIDIISNIQSNKVINKKVLKDKNNYYLCNLYLNNKTKAKYICKQKGNFNKYISKIL
jgi:hypothetical protein